MLVKEKKYRFYALIILLLLPLSLFAESIAVVYPNIREPYLSVFKEIVSGIKSSVKDLKVRRIKKGATAEELQAWVDKKKVNTVIALGQKGLEQARVLEGGRPLVLGAILLPPKNSDEINAAGIALSPSPEKLFSQLRQFSSQVTTINVIYNENNNGWLINYAQQAARDLNFTLRAMPATGLAEAANLYRDLLNEPLDNTQAIWLLQDRKTVDSKTILPTILNSAWAKKFIVFSSNPAYVKRGILFSLFPDNKAMGSSLGAIANELQQESGVKSQSIRPLTDLKIAVNLRAAEHLGLAFDKNEKRSFDLVFPPQR